MSRILNRLVLMLLLACAWQGARADTPIRLFQSFIGNVNFVGTQVTVRDKANNNPCKVFDSGTNRTATLSGIPAGATILSAQLYWAASNFNPDYTVFFDDVALNAADDRRYYSSTIGNNFNYYSGAADVTAQVKQKGNGKYAFRGLTVDKDAPYCAVEGVLGGFSLLVIYADSAQPFRLLNLYEGFQYMRYSGITLNLSGFRVPNPLGAATGRVAHITWEGDSTLLSSGENLLFNGSELTDSMNTSGNQFNSKSSVNGDNQSYGIDFDAYTVGSPVIRPGDTTASTRYESGQDLVLLSAEIVAMPNIPMADLSIEMTRDGELALGKDVSYSITVSNKGPSTADAPTVVTNTLPDELTFVSAQGSGWSCGAVGRQVTCSSNTAIASGASLPVLTISAKLVASGTITNTASVTGKTFDPDTANNTATARGTAAGDADFVLTDSACVVGLPLGHSSQTCSTTLPPVRAGVDADIFITAVKNGVPTILSPVAPSAEPVRLALSCHKPGRNAGVTATFAGVTLPLCTADGNEPTVWTSQTVVIPPAVASVAYKFRYEDVGRVQLFLQSVKRGTISAGLPFVSTPYEIRLTRKGGEAFPASPLASNAPVFVRAGEMFEMSVGSYSAQGKLTPNFGAEGTGEFDMPSLERGAADPAAGAAMISIPALGGSFEPIAGGAAVGKNFRWDEVGLLKLTPALKLGNYLGHAVNRVPAYLGRFYPDHFTTSASMMDCLANMRCETATTDVGTAAYSKEPLAVTVTARAVGGAATKNYQGVFARQVQLSAWENPKVRYNNLPGLTQAIVAASAFNNLDGSAKAQPVFTLANGFVNTAPQAFWSAPTSIFLRAAEIDGDGVHSLSASDPHEVGIQIVSGRLLVPNAHGSERLSLPLKVSAQYWTGSNWELSRTDKRNLIDPSPPKAAFSNFAGALAGGSLGLLPQAAQVLADGVAKFNVKASPAASGSADLVIDHLPWLPSTRGRLKFGTYRSPLIYLREIH